MSIREVEEGTQVIGVTEVVTWSVDVTEWGGSPSNPTMTVTRLSDGEDVTADVTSGSMSANAVSSLVFCKPIDGREMTAGELYRVTVTFDVAGMDPGSCKFYVRAEA